jgi:hypothetical protein
MGHGVKLHVLVSAVDECDWVVLHSDYFRWMRPIADGEQKISISAGNPVIHPVAGDVSEKYT